ncbi:MAG TPA: hypothetical protein VFT67_09920 [Jatrophihabitantaceae bacterium]|nr:hypothetical protein [Jatrophihabitantaceae bacterium]
MLDEERVSYVVVGGYAARLYGARRPTEDIDISPAVDTDNLTALTRALKRLDSRTRVAEVPGGLPFDTSAEALRGITILNLTTRYGDLDLTVVPAGTGGFADLVGSAVAHSLEGRPVLVAALSDVIRSKEAAGRPKDLEALPELYRLARRDEQTSTADDAGRQD